MFDLTAAHPTLPLGSRVRVTNLRNGRAITVRINDRGPIVPGRIIDLSYGAARVLGVKAKGLQRVRLDVVKTQAPQTMALLRPLAY
jgi:rare lipoprotein A